MFYNTNKEHDKELKDHQLKALTQEEKILQFFIVNRKKAFTAWEVAMKVGDMVITTPITSYRRAINSLVELGKIIETGELRMGALGRKVRTYQYKNKTK